MFRFQAESKADFSVACSSIKIHPRTKASTGSLEKLYQNLAFVVFIYLFKRNFKG